MILNICEELRLPNEHDLIEYLTLIFQLNLFDYITYKFHAYNIQQSHSLIFNNDTKVVVL